MVRVLGDVGEDEFDLLEIKRTDINPKTGMKKAKRKSNRNSVPKAADQSEIFTISVQTKIVTKFKNLAKKFKPDESESESNEEEDEEEMAEELPKPVAKKERSPAPKRIIKKVVGAKSKKTKAQDEENSNQNGKKKNELDQ